MDLWGPNPCLELRLNRLRVEKTVHRNGERERARREGKVYKRQGVVMVRGQGALLLSTYKAEDDLTMP